jgi:SAM-dependent methyltransferase
VADAPPLHDRSYAGWDQDPLGQALLAYRAGRRDAAVATWSDLEGWDRLPCSRLFRAGAALPLLERRALALCRGRVLDLGAGAGGHALALHRRGLDVAAMDHSPGACRVMRARGLRVVTPGDWRGDEPEGGPFDTVLALMNGLGLAGSLAELPRFLGRLAGWLRPGGQVLLDSADLIYLFTVEGGHYQDLRKDHYGEVTYRMRYGRARTGDFGWLFLDPDTLTREARAAGWRAEIVHRGRFHDYLARLTPA